jgi:DNA-directed RNA polymerase subunit E'/Rpb7
MNTPYFNTYLSSNISLHSSQMKNGAGKFLKENLIKRIEGKCYKKFGHVTKIYNIVDKKKGIIVPEDSTSSALYEVKFGCKLCKPIDGTIIICEILKMMKSIIILKNGPIDIVIFEGKGHINETNFVYDDKRNTYLAKINEEKGIPVKIGTYVQVKVISTQIEDRSSKLIVIGTLEKLATQDEIDNSIDILNNDDLPFIKYDDYEIKFSKKEVEEVVVEEVEDKETDTESSDESESD